jgi:hypothetical protein
MSYEYAGWSRRGMAADDSQALTTTYTAYTVGTNANVARSSGFPDDCFLHDIRFQLSAMATTGTIPTQVWFYIALDAAGTKPLTNIYKVDIVKALGATAATGGCRQIIELAVNHDDYTGPLNRGDLYVIARMDQGTATAKTVVNWLA